MDKTLKQGNHKLVSAEESRVAIAEAERDDPLTMERVGNLLRFVDAQGRLLGTLTNRSSVAKELDAGFSLLHCSVSWKYEASDRYPNGLLSARVATGDPEDTYAQWCALNVWGKRREVRPPRAYAVNIVGESFFQDAIVRCDEGDPVTLYREIGNPHDPRAVVAKTSDGSTIGYLPSTSWVQRVIHEEGSGVAATIEAVHATPTLAVVLAVTVTGVETGEVQYEATR